MRALFKILFKWQHFKGQLFLLSLYIMKLKLTKKEQLNQRTGK